MNKLLRMLPVFTIPIVIIFLLNIAFIEMGKAGGPLLTFLVFWFWLFAHKLTFQQGEIDTGTYGGFLFAAIPVLTIIGVIWGLSGLIVFKWGGIVLRDFSESRYYSGISILWFVIIFSFQNIFRKKPVSGSFRQGGRIEIDRGVMKSHESPITKEEPSSDGKID